MEQQEKTQKKPTLEDIKRLAIEKGISVKEYKNNGLNLKENEKTIANVFTRNYGLSWQVKGNYEKITNMEQLINKFDNNLWTIEIPEKKTQLRDDTKKSKEGLFPRESPLIPKKFIYIPRNVETGNSDVDEFSEAMKEGKNVLLEGPTGSGKTTLVRFYCAENNLPYKRVSLNGGCTVEDLIGHYILKNNSTEWVDGILTQAVRNGYILAVDEINAAPSEVLFVLNSLLDDERILILSSKDGEIIVPHPNFRLIATMNPTEQGYAGTQEVNEALRDRFHVTFYIDYNDKVEKKILKSMGIDGEKINDIMALTKKLREAYVKAEIITPFSTRSVINFAELILSGKEKLIINRFRGTDKPVINDTMDMFIYKTKSVEENKDENQPQP